jgi:hypothetical protein
MLQAMVSIAEHVTSVNNHFSYTYYIVAGVIAAIAVVAFLYITLIDCLRVNSYNSSENNACAVIVFFFCAFISGMIFANDPGTTYTIYGNVVSAGYDGDVYEHFINIDGTKIYHDDYDENRRLLNKYVKMTCDTQSTGDSVSSRHNICMVAKMSDKKITPDSKGGSN